MRLGSKAGMVCTPNQRLSCSQVGNKPRFLSICLDNTFVGLHVACGLRRAHVFSAVLSPANSIPFIYLCRHAITHSGISNSRDALCYQKLLWSQERCKKKKKSTTWKRKKKQNPHPYSSRNHLSPASVRTERSCPPTLRGACPSLSAWCWCLCCCVEVS